MKKMLVFLLCLLVLCLMAVPGASAADISVRDEFAAHFAGFTGTFVMYDPAGDKYIVYNEPISKKRLSPVPPSKFTTRSSAWKPAYWTRKMYTRCSNGTGRNTLSLLEPRSYHGIGHRSRWCGTSRLARIGPERMQEYIDKIGYGNKDISGGLTTFWLGSSLQISALEQVRPAQQAIFRATAVLSREYRDSAKEHHSFRGRRHQADGQNAPRSVTKKWVSGWFVGCVNKDGRYYVFATNIEAADGANGGKAREITKSILKEMGIL